MVSTFLVPTRVILQRKPKNWGLILAVDAVDRYFFEDNQ